HADRPHNPLGCRKRPVPVKEAMHEVTRVLARGTTALPHARAELIHRPGVTLRNVKAGGGHILPRLDPRLVPGAATARNPRTPGRHVDLSKGMEVRPKRTDPRRLVGSLLRLVVRERRDGDVVLRTRGCTR